MIRHLNNNIASLFNFSDIVAVYWINFTTLRADGSIPDDIPDDIHDENADGDENADRTKKILFEFDTFSPDQQISSLCATLKRLGSL